MNNISVFICISYSETAQHGVMHTVVCCFGWVHVEESLFTLFSAYIELLWIKASAK